MDTDIQITQTYTSVSRGTQGEGASAPDTSSATTTTYTHQIMTSESYFHDMRQFLYNCRHDKRLSPATQLVYRILVSVCNCHYWSTSFTVSDAELKEISHISSNSDLTRVKRTLKTLGYIDFHGKPSAYTIYSPPVHESVQEPVHSGVPQTPCFNTERQQHNTLEERKEKEKKEGARDGRDEQPRGGDEALERAKARLRGL